MTLADFSTGMSGTIESVDPADGSIIRLMVLGLVEGARVRLRHAAIGGDPLEVEVMGAAISVRREQARSFRVSVD
jgi:Fe2+ transport system protein FeoA